MFILIYISLAPAIVLKELWILKNQSKRLKLFMKMHHFTFSFIIFKSDVCNLYGYRGERLIDPEWPTSYEGMVYDFSSLVGWWGWLSIPQGLFPLLTLNLMFATCMVIEEKSSLTQSSLPHMKACCMICHHWGGGGLSIPQVPNTIII